MPFAQFIDMKTNQKIECLQSPRLRSSWSRGYLLGVSSVACTQVEIAELSEEGLQLTGGLFGAAFRAGKPDPDFDAGLQELEIALGEQSNSVLPSGRIIREIEEKFHVLKGKSVKFKLREYLIYGTEH